MPEHVNQQHAPAETPGAGVPEPPIVHELTGPLRCVGCRYELRGLSIEGNCPECGLPIRATLLSMVDPHALELRPIGRPGVVVSGLVLWVVGSLLALVAGLAAWTGAQLVATPGGRWQTGVVLGGAWALAASGVGAIVIVRPHGGMAPRRLVAAGFAVLLYPIAVKLYLDAASALGDGASMLAAWSGATGSIRWRAERLALWLTLALMAWLLRPNLRLLASRSLVLRSRRVDRQTIAATVAAMLIAAAGDTLGIVVGLADGRGASLVLLAEVLVGLGVLLLALGMLGIARDTLRLLPAVLYPPLAIGDVLHQPRPAAAP